MATASVRTPGRLLVLAASLLAYAAAVSGVVQAAVDRADALGCIDPHAVQVQWILVAGLAGGLAVGPLVGRWGSVAARALLPEAGEARRTAFLRGAAFSLLAAAAVLNALGVDTGLNRFIDLHRTILVELDLLLYAMGALGGAAWHLLLERHGWLGLLLMPAMALMLIGSGVTGGGWC